MNKSEIELQKIAYQCKRFDERYKCEMDMIIIYVVRELGYVRYNYIPDNIKNDIFYDICSKIRQYMRKYSITLPVFCHKLKEMYNYCKINGYSIEVNQKQLKEFDVE